MTSLRASRLQNGFWHIFKAFVNRERILWGSIALMRRWSLSAHLTLSQSLFARSLIPNHFHLLLHGGPSGLPTFMRRLLTGYAITFNERYERSGHLFQNRYKSIVCEEDPYVLELVRYIHLNPLRSRVVRTLDALGDVHGFFVWPWEQSLTHALFFREKLTPGSSSSTRYCFYLDQFLHGTPHQGTWAKASLTLKGRTSTWATGALFFSSHRSLCGARLTHALNSPNAFRYRPVIVLDKLSAATTM